MEYTSCSVVNQLSVYTQFRYPRQQKQGQNMGKVNLSNQPKLSFMFVNQILF